MTIDYKRLKHLALAQPNKEWTREEGEPSMTTGERMFYIRGAGGVSCYEHGARDRVSAAYIEAACPATVLALLAEIERLETSLSGYQQGAQVEADAADEARAEVRSLKAENEALRKTLLEASEEIATWGAYASDYFQEKHDLAGCVAKFHDAAMSKESGHD